jgi:hypothetical protein
LLKHVRAAFVGTDTGWTSLGQIRFRVEEKFRGVKGDYIDLEPFPGGVRFQVGEQYLVFVGVWQDRAVKHIFAAGPWEGTRELKYASAILEQLRAEKNGRRNDSAYGMFLVGEDFHPLPGVVVRIQSKEKSFETTTDERGAYAFARLPGGTYRLSADLPPGLQLRPYQSLGFELPRGACYENDIIADPAAKSNGR